MEMDITIFFARLWGGFFLVFGALFIITRQLGRTIEMTDDKAFVISTGYITFLMGLVTVILHNVWVADWEVVITILGWSTLLKGIGKIGFPELIHQQAQRFKKKQWLSAVFLILFGAWLMWMSFMWQKPEQQTTQMPEIPLGDNLSDEQLLQYARSSFDKEEMMFKDFILGDYNGNPVRVSFPCSDLCPDYTIRIIRYDGNLSDCESMEGEIRSIYVPVGIAIIDKEFCFPKIIVDNNIYDFADK